MNKRILQFAGVFLSAFAVNAQCPQITCPGDINVSSDVGSCDAVVTYTEPQGVDPCASGNVTFTNCSATGRYGPTQGQVDAEYAGGPLDGQVTINTQGIQEWTVPFTGTYTIEVAGASGGGPGVPGNGASMIGDFNLTQGDVLKILVGQQGIPFGTSSAGGGGGTFVTTLSNTPLIIGGGGSGVCNSEVGVDAQTGNDGGGINPGTSGNGGACGGAGSQSGSGGGGGLLTDGATCTYGLGGFAFVNGGEGGDNSGGFGGGGGNTNGGANIAGGGGGYSGGSGNIHPGTNGVGGGGSFNSGTNQNNTAGANTGHGYVNITWSGTPVTTTQTAGFSSGSTFPLGTTVNTFEATDGSGNTATCSFNVTVVDGEAPTLDSTSLSDVEAECEVNSLDAPTATDLCDGSVTGTSDAVFPIDNDTVVVWTYEDAEGNSITQNQNVVITGLDVSVSMSGITLTANKSGATYQWIDCSDSSLVADADGQSFTPTQNGDYAVIITDGNCTDTSACESVTSVGVQENLLKSNISLYPNPNNGSFTLDLGEMISEGEVQVLDIQGRVVQSIKIENTQELEMEITQQSGVYMLKVTTEDGQAMIRVVKKD